MLEECLTQLVENLALDNALFKENQLFLLKLHKELIITFLELDPGCTFFATIGTCPLNKQEEVFIYLMKANLLGQGTGGSVIGLSRDEKFLTLRLVLPYDMNYKVFKDALEDFTNYLDFWKNELSYYQ
ncbi:MAG: type III secretion system chaperone [Chlamydiales bacterium]|jgi:hypothetical protein|nr:type III secretion system chaperone [Chlamydiales bacterium]